MSCILHINTAGDVAYVCLSEDDNVLDSRESLFQNQHSSFLQPAIKELLSSAGKSVDSLAAVSVVNGPGSYTGLRVGLSAAKGICYALNIPLINISTLEWLAHPYKTSEFQLIVPMIDARRMEVFTATYDSELNLVSVPKALILNEQSFDDILGKYKIMFTGSGAKKLPGEIVNIEGVTVTDTNSSCHVQLEIALQLFDKKDFADLAYVEPFYLKPFHSTIIR